MGLPLMTDIKTPRLTAHDVPPNSNIPALSGEHGVLARWVAERMDGLERKFERAIERVHDLLSEQRDRLSAMEGAEEARKEWRDDVTTSLRDISAAVHASPAATQRGILTERTLPMLIGAVMLAGALFLAWAVIFGDESALRGLDHVRAIAPKP